MYESDAKAEENTLIGELTQKLGLDQQQDETECWPDNWLACQVFEALATQWNVGAGGVIGLRYESMPVIFDAFGIKKKQRSEMVYLMRLMENEALQVINGRH
jgi:hypothetical protein